MILDINDKKTIGDIRKEFSNEYLFLKIEFYDEWHKFEEASSGKHILPHNKLIGDIRKVHKSGKLKIYPWHKTGNVEQRFRKSHGLNIQIFYRVTDRWIQTAGTDSLTIGEQNEIGRKAMESLLHGSENPIEREKRL